MLPDPLHPAVVHFPVVLAALLPLCAAAGLVAIRRGARRQSTWGVVFLLSLAMTASTLVAAKTGEDEEDRVEDVVPESALEEHEEAGERLRIVSALTTLIIAAGLFGGRPGNTARWAGVAAAFAVLGGAIQSGHSGGELVYKHGAAQAYLGSPNQDGEKQGDDTGEERDDREERPIRQNR